MLIKVSSAIFAQVNQNATNLVNILKGGVATIIIWTKQARMYDQEIGDTILAALESVNHLLYFSKTVIFWLQCKQNGVLYRQRNVHWLSISVICRSN